MTPSRSAKKRKKKKGECLFKRKEQEVSVTKLQRFTSSKFYEFASGTLIITNSLFLGYQTQYLAELWRDNALRNDPLPDPPGAFLALHILFCLAFIVELVLRWIADGFVEFFRTEDVWWNVLDVVVVSTSSLELLLDMIAELTNTEKSDALQTVSVIRVLRVVRVVRVARVIRVMKFFRELRMMIYSILGSAKNLIWVIVVLAMTFYLFGVAFTAATSDFLDTSEKWRHPDNVPLIESFGTIDKSVLSLFFSMSGGNDWAMYYEALIPLPAYYRFAYLLYIAFALFAVVNVVTGVFVESAMQVSVKDKDIIVHEELQAKKKYLSSMQEIFEEMDEDCKGTISLQEFEEKLKDERVIAYFNVLKLDVSDARTLFQLLDYDNSDEVGIDEFLEGCYKLQGVSRSLDMKIMQYEVQQLTINQQVSFQDVREMLEEVRFHMQRKPRH